MAEDPYRELPLKLPSGLVSMHESTPLAVQKIDVREPTDTEAGDAHIETCGTIYGPAGAGTTGFEVTGGLAAGFAVTTGVAATGNTPTLNPLDEQILSKSEAEIPAETRGFCHGRTRHIRSIMFCGGVLACALEPKKPAASVLRFASRMPAWIVAPVDVS